MLKPSYAELMDVLNSKESESNNVKSRYTIVIAAAKRARQLIDGDEPMVEGVKVDKPVSVAVEELRQGKIQIVPEGQGTVLNLKKSQEEEFEAIINEVSAIAAESNTENEAFDNSIDDVIEEEFSNIVAMEDNGEE